MRAKFAGRCRSCGGHFEAGAEISWSRARGALHITCATSESGISATERLRRAHRRDLIDRARAAQFQALRGRVL